MTDRIFVDNLRLSCRVGITPEERRQPQEVLVDVSIFLSLVRAGRSDDVRDTVNYKEVVQRVSLYVSGKEFTLLEGLAEGVVSAVLDAFPVERVVVKVRKAKYSDEPSIGIEVARDRESWSSRS
jgi:dihydroneopterin aldolase